MASTNISNEIACDLCISVHLCAHRVVHSFTCAGMLEVQYTKLCKFASIGAVGHHYIRTGTGGHHEVSIRAAVDKVQSKPSYTQMERYTVCICTVALMISLGIHSSG